MKELKFNLEPAVKCEGVHYYPQIKYICEDCEVFEGSLRIHIGYKGSGVLMTYGKPSKSSEAAMVIANEAIKTYLSKVEPVLVELRSNHKNMTVVNQSDNLH